MMHLRDSPKVVDYKPEHFNKGILGFGVVIGDPVHHVNIKTRYYSPTTSPSSADDQYAKRQYYYYSPSMQVSPLRKRMHYNNQSMSANTMDQQGFPLVNNFKPAVFGENVKTTKPAAMVVVGPSGHKRATRSNLSSFESVWRLCTLSS